MEWFGRDVQLIPDWLNEETDRFGVVLIADEHAEAAARAAVATAGGRVLERVDWHGAPSELDRYPNHPVVMVDTAGVDAALLEATLPHLDRAVAALDLPLVAMLEEAEIDIVAGALLGGGVQLLCRPSPAEQVAALAVAARHAGAPALADVREGEAERLRRLNDEVARIAAVLAQLTAREESSRVAIGDVFDRRPGFDAGPGPDDSGDIDPLPVRQAIRARRMRDMFFGEGLFEDPAWDMLLDLFAAELEGTRVSVSSLCIAAAVAPTTALRWIGKLTDVGLFERRPDPVDRRRAFMALSAKGLAGMRAYAAALRRAGLPVV